MIDWFKLFIFFTALKNFNHSVLNFIKQYLESQNNTAKRLVQKYIRMKLTNRYLIKNISLGLDINGLEFMTPLKQRPGYILTHF